MHPLRSHLHRRSLLVPVILVLSAIVPLLGQSPVAITGRVTAAAGVPIAGAVVTLGSPGPPSRTVTTGADGAFVFESVPHGALRLTATATGFSPVVHHLTIDTAAPPVLTLTLLPLINERIQVVGGPALVDRIPGSAHVIDGTEMARLTMATDDIHQMLRQVPGLNIQEEDGYGLRPNIGIRGSGSDRSSKITLMEDGVLIAPAPYAAPAAYYAPTAARMESLEIRKGSSQVKYGPVTTGGVLNYVSTSVPSDFTLRTTIAGGGDHARRIMASLGDARPNAGWLVETFQFRNDGFKVLDGGGSTGVDLEDYLAKVRLNTTPTPRGYQELELKLGRTDQLGDETYLGLTDADFERTPYRRYAGSQVDTFTSTHTQYQARHLLARRTWDVTTVVYRNNFARAWYKLESVMGAGLAALLSSPHEHAERLAVLGGDDSAAHALVVRNNNRTYFGSGVQSVLGLRPMTGTLRHQLEIGVRYHRDEEDRFQQDDAYQMVGGRMVLTRPGAPGSQTNQVVGARALAGFVADTMTWGRWRVSPGLRYEHIDLNRLTYSRTDPARIDAPAALAATVTAVIPGLGLAYDWRPAVSLFGGVHRGFAPPGPGATEGTGVESSVNYELGARVRRGTAGAEVVGFFNDYDNLLGRDSLATGGSGTGELFNGGRVRVHGVEASGHWNPAARLGLSSSLPVRLSYSFARAEFRSSFQSQFGPWGTVASGDELPYVPRHQVYASVESDHRTWRARLEAYAVGRMRTAAGQGALVEAESTPAYWGLTVSGEYVVRTGASLFVSVQNLTNNVAVVSRHPAGVRPGLPRLVQAGLRLSLGR
ncbi:MAG TPA: TonB-dependent receptor [Vicinamibacterales bacterium]|nr:TonB-dependent receptor [Vicinamibacterales bacterium]